MTDCEKEFEDAKKNLSEQQTLYNEIKPDIEAAGENNLSEEDQLVWLTVKTRFSSAARRLQDARAALKIEQAAAKRLSDQSTISKTSLLERVNTRLDELAKTLRPKNTANRKQTRAEAAEQERRANGKKALIAKIYSRSDEGNQMADIISNQFTTKGYCPPFDSLEEWQAILAARPSKEEVDLRNARNMDAVLAMTHTQERKEALEGLSDTSTETLISDEEFDRLYGTPKPPPSDSYQKPVLDIDPEKLRNEILSAKVKLAKEEKENNSDGSKNPNDSSTSA